MSSLTPEPLEFSAAVWGLGYIGLTTADALLRAGFTVLGLEVDARRWEELRSGSIVLNDSLGLAIDVSAPLREGRLSLAARFPDNTRGILWHFVCVPTEVEGKPTRMYFDSVVDQIRSRSPNTTVIVESTLAPDWLLTGAYDDLDLVIAPRRDWFHSAHHTLQSLTRICACANPRTLSSAQEILVKISPNLVTSPDPIAACVSKSFENTIWYVIFSYVDELADLLNDVDVREVLRLAQTNWRTPFQLTLEFQVGGYCLPLAAQYLQEIIGGEGSEILRASIRANERLVASVLARICMPPRINRVLILGLTYRSGIRVTTNSAGSKITAACLAEGLEVYVHDPLYSEEEIEHLTDAHYLNPDDDPTKLPECVVVCVKHESYLDDTLITALRSSPQLRRVIDCFGILDNQGIQQLNGNIEYVAFGTAAWKHDPA